MRLRRELPRITRIAPLKSTLPSRQGLNGGSRGGAETQRGASAAHGASRQRLRRGGGTVTLPRLRAPGPRAEPGSLPVPPLFVHPVHPVGERSERSAGQDELRDRMNRMNWRERQEANGFLSSSGARRGGVERSPLPISSGSGVRSRRPATSSSAAPRLRGSAAPREPLFEPRREETSTREERSASSAALRAAGAPRQSAVSSCSPAGAPWTRVSPRRGVRR